MVRYSPETEPFEILTDIESVRACPVPEANGFTRQADALTDQMSVKILRHRLLPRLTDQMSVSPGRRVRDNRVEGGG